MGKEKLTKAPEVIAAIIGTIVGTLLVSILLGFLRGRIALETDVAVVAFVVAFLLLISIWVLLAIRWGLHLAIAAAAVMVTAAPLIPISVPPATPTPIPSPTKIPIPSPADQEARAFAEPILAAIAGREPTLSDDFSDPGSGWEIKTRHWGEIGYQDGEYFIIVNPPGCNLVVAPVPEVSDFVLEIDGRFVSGIDGGIFLQLYSWYVDFRSSYHPYPISGDYTVCVRPDGGLSIRRRVNTEGVYLCDIDGDAIKWGYETNHLQIIAKGPQIALYVNGEPLCLVYDETLSTGRIELRACCGHDDTPLRVHFDNFKIWDISDLSP